MNTNIWINGRFTDIDPKQAVKTTRNITSFCVSNNLRDCLFKSQGGWYKLERDGIMVFVTRTLYLISFEDLYSILKD